MTSIFRIFFFLTISSVVCPGQSFEGKVTYETAYKSKIPNVTDALYTEMMGKSQEYNLKNGNYRTTSNGTFLQWQLYLNKDNKLYTKFSNSASVLWNDGAVNPDSVLKTEFNKEIIDILGYKCDELILTCRSGIQKYYFNSKLKIDPKLFENHKFGNWYQYLSHSQAVPLKMILDNVQFSVVIVATAIQPQKIDDQLFLLPADAKLEKSPF